MTNKPVQIDNMEDTIDLKEVLDIVFTHKWIVLLCVVIAVCIGAFYCKFRTPLYQTDLLLNVSGGSSSSLLSSLVGGNNANSQGSAAFLGGGNGAATTEQDIVMSRSVLEPTVQQLHLDVVTTPAYFPLIGKRMALNYDLTNYANKIAPSRFWGSGYNWGGSTLTVQQFTVSPYFQGQNFKIIYTGDNHYDLYDKNGIKLAMGTIGQPLQLQPLPYATITLNIQAIQAFPGTIFFIQQQKMPLALVQLQSALKVAPVEQFSSLLKLTLTGEDPVKITNTLNTIGKQAVLNSVNQTVQQATQLLEFLHGRLPQAEVLLNSAENALNQYRAKSGNIDLPSQTKSLMQNINQLQTELSQTQLQKIQLQQQYTDDSYPIQQVNQAITQYQQQLQQLELQLRSTPNSDQTLVTLTRNVTIQNAIYTSLLNNIQQYELIKAATIGNVSVVDTATVPYAPINMSGLVILAISAFLGFFVSLLYIFVRRFLWHGIESTDVLEHQLDLSVLSVIHESRQQKAQRVKLKKRYISYLKLMSEIDPQGLEVESLRSLRTSLLFKLKQKGGNIITITGPAPGIGKSFVSANLAHLLADSGLRVLLIDADIRRGDLYYYFDVPRKPGLTDLIQGAVTPETVIHKTRIANLDFMPTGVSVSHHAELLLQPECKTAIEQLAQHYDIVLIDTAPVLALTDATILGAFSALRLLVVAYGQHPEHELAHAVQQFTKVGQTVDGCIFNRVPQRTRDGYGYGYGYRYHYRSKKHAT